MKILAVTACPSGIAYTYMAAEAIRRACQKAGIECKIETQGMIGVENNITYDDLLSSNAVILTTDVPIINEERFKNIKQIRTDIASVIRYADDIVAEAANMSEPV